MLLESKAPSAMRVAARISSRVNSTSFSERKFISRVISTQILRATTNPSSWTTLSQLPSFSEQFQLSPTQERRRSFSTTPSSSSSVSDFRYLTMERRGKAWWITLNRPDLHNAFNEDVITEITTAFDKVAENPGSSRAVVLAGNGPSFSAGADLNWMKKMATYTEEENKKDSDALFRMFEAIRYSPLPVIARVNGAALGGGSGLVACCDIAVALDNASFGFTEVKLGLVPAVISRFVIDKIGYGGASRYFLTGERFDAKEALRVGLIQNHYTTPEALDKEVERYIDELAKNSPAAVTTSKGLIEKVRCFDSARETREYVTGVIAKVRVSSEGQEGLSAFLNKRKPNWTQSSPK